MKDTKKKVNSFRFFVGLSFLFLSFALQSAIRLDDQTAQEIKNLRSEIEIKKNEVSRLDQELKSLEGKLSQHNDRYVQVIKIKNKIESEVYNLRTRINKNQQSLQKGIDKAQKVLQAAVLSHLESSHSPSSLLGEKIVLKKLNEELTELKEDKQAYTSLESKLEELEERYQEYNSVEGELASVLANLEAQREKKTSHYVEISETTDEVQSRYESLKTKIFLSNHSDSSQARERVGGLLFSMPVDNFNSMEHEDKGVTFRYQGRNKVLNAAKGRVVYKGKLSTYGNVVMIDHGNDTRSVFLGHFQPNVKEGKMLESGELIGHTTGNSSRGRNDGEVYFEVRKHNEVQNTILLLDQERLLASVLDSRV